MDPQENGTADPTEPMTRQETMEMCAQMVASVFDQYLNQRPTTMQLALLNVTPQVIDATIPDADNVPKAHKIIKSIDPISGVNVDMVLDLERAHALADALKKPKIDTFSRLPEGAPPPPGQG